MTKVAFRLVRLLPSGSFEYLESMDGESFRWSTEPADGLIFDSWSDWVAAATAYLYTSGPVDLILEKIYTLPWRPVCHA